MQMGSTQALALKLFSVCINTQIALQNAIPTTGHFSFPIKNYNVISMLQT